MSTPLPVSVGLCYYDLSSHRVRRKGRTLKGKRRGRLHRAAHRRRLQCADGGILVSVHVHAPHDGTNTAQKQCGSYVQAASFEKAAGTGAPRSQDFKNQENVCT